MIPRRRKGWSDRRDLMRTDVAIVWAIAFGCAIGAVLALLTAEYGVFPR